MKNIYIGITTKIPSEDVTRYYSSVMKVSENYNIKNALRDPRIIVANIFPTKKRAEQVVKWWNDGYRKNGTYLFGEWEG